MTETRNWLEHNFSVLKKRDPELARLVSQTPDASAPVSPSADAEAENFWKAQTLKNPMLLCFYGLGSGHPLKHALKKPHPRTQAVLVIEKNPEVFRQALKLQDWSAALADPSIEWLIARDPAVMRYWALRYFQKIQNLLYCGATENVFWTPALEKEGAYYVSVARALSEGSQDALLSLGGEPEDNFRGLLNLTGNLDHLARSRSFDDLAGLFANKPGIVVSTGPSLNAALPALKAAQDKAVIFACDSAVPVLLDAGIRPHFIACLERVVATKRLFEVLPPLPDTWLVAIPLVYPESLAAYQGPKFFLHPRGMQFDWLLGDRTDHWLGLSASNLAYQGLNILGCDPIILMGQDLAFDRSTHKSHAQGAISFLQEVGAQKHREVQESDRPENWVPGNDGTPILSWEPYRLIAQCFAQMIHESGRRTINAIDTHYGMKITNAEWRDPPDALGQFCKEPVPAVAAIRGRWKEPDEKEVGAKKEALRRRIRENCEGLKRLQKRTLKNWEDFSVFYHHHLPSLVTPELSRAYEEECLRGAAEMNALLKDEPVFLKLLWPFVVKMHVTQIMKYYELRGGGEPFEKSLKPMFAIHQNWQREVFLWVSRLLAHLESIS